MRRLWGELTDTAPTSCPARDERTVVARVSFGLLLSLVVLAAVPRGMMTWRLNTYCNDAYLYMGVAECWERGDEGPLLTNFGVNLYPLILKTGHQIGLGWGLTGELWGVIVGSLLVLPLFGWVRRLYDDRLAIAACFLYAVHPGFVEIGVEPIRDGTFWFLTTLTLYLFVRALEETIRHRFVWCLFTGVSFALTVRTRSEGWLLLVPLFLWALGAWRCQPVRRPSLVWGTALLAVAVAVTDLTLCRGVLQEQHSAHVGLSRHFAAARNWLNGENTSVVAAAQPSPAAPQPITPLPPPPTPAPVLVETTNLLPAPSAPAQEALNVAAVSAPSDPAPLPTSEVEAAATPLTPPRAALGQSEPLTAEPKESAVVAAAEVYQPGPVDHAMVCLKNLLKVLTVPNVLFLICGTWMLRTRLWQWESAALWLFSGVLLGAVWLLLVVYGVTNSRYFLSAVLLLLPFQAAGLLWVLRQVAIRRLATWRRWIPERQAATMALVLLFSYGCGDALWSNHPSRTAEVEVAHWIREIAGTEARVFCVHEGRRIGYHVADTVAPIVNDATDLERLFADGPPEWLVLSQPFLNRSGQPAWYTDPQLVGLEQVDLDNSQPMHNELMLFRRSVRRTADSGSLTPTSRK